MDWSIIATILATLATFDLGKFIFFKITKREKEADVKGKEKENESKEVETLRNTIDTLAEQLKSAHATIKDYEERNRALSDENGSLKATVTALFDDMCVHKGCRLRKPHQGQGQRWYEEYRKDPSLGADYFSVETLIRQERLRRIAKEKVLAEPEQDGNDQ